MATADYHEFDKNDTEYYAWIEEHPSGFIINTGRNHPPEYMVLHRATCSHISKPVHEASPGGFTERDFIKICADDVEALRDWVANHGRPDRSFSTECSHCKPTR